jgi:hypothetical protein
MGWVLVLMATGQAENKQQFMACSNFPAVDRV